MIDTNLTNAELNKAQFVGADLQAANLSYGQLTSAGFNEAKLDSAILRGADLRDADLRRTSLHNTDFRDADLRDADLTGAELSGADFSGAVLKGAKFHRATCGNTIFGNNDLSEVIGLDETQHWRSSTISIDTIYRSNGKIPVTFLRGAGIPDDFIEIISSLTAQPIQFYSCFISYSYADNEFAQRLYSDLQNKGVRCWFAPEDLKAGDKIRVRIDESIRIHDKLLLILSKHSIKSEWVEKEVETALERERERDQTVLFPISLDDEVMHAKSGWPALIRNTRAVGDFKKWKDFDAYQKALDRLLRDLRATTHS